MEPQDAGREGMAQSLLARRRKALLVHEEPEALIYYRNIMEAWAYHVRACHTYEEGMNCLESETFEVAVVSQGSQNFEGRCVLERAIEIDRRLPVLVVARCLDINCYLEAMRLGAVDYLAEPITALDMGRALAGTPLLSSW